MEYRLIRARRKTMALTIDPNDLTVVVTAPILVPRATITAFVEKHRRWIETHTAALQKRLEHERQITPSHIARWRARAEAEIPAKVAYYAAKMGVTPTGVKITSAQKRFGSCSGKNALCFSYRLMAYPPEAIDYVVVHELAHIREHNHGPRFYQAVAAVFPDYKQRERLLKEPVTLSDD